MAKKRARKGKDAIAALKALFLLCAAAYVAVNYPIWVDDIPAGWENCIRYAGEGSLYRGQPYCNKGPTVYYIGWAVSSVLGMSRLWLGMAYIKIALLAAVFLWTYGLIRKPDIHLTALLFIVLIYPNAADKPDSLLATALFLSGFRVQFRTRPRNWQYLTGACYALALAVKYTVLYPIALLFIAHLLINRKKLNDAFFDCAKTASPAIAASAALYVIFPNIWAYTVEGHILDPAMSTFEAFKVVFLSWDINTLAMCAYVVASAYALYSWRLDTDDRLHILLPMVCIPLMTVNLTKSLGTYSLTGQYALPLYPFLASAAHIVRRDDKTLFAAFTAVALIYPGVGGSIFSGERTKYLSKDRQELDRLVGSGFAILPAPKRALLFESGSDDIGEIGRIGESEFFKRWGWEVPKGRNMFIKPGGEFTTPEDPYWAPRLRKILNISDEYQFGEIGLSPEEENVKGEIMAGRYDVIVNTPKSWMTTTRILHSIGDEKLRGYCELYVPDFLHQGNGREYKKAIYDNWTICENAMESVAKHYLAIYDSVCEKSRRAAEIVKMVNYKNGFLIDKNCLESRDVEKNTAERGPQAFDIVMMALSAVVLLLFARAD